MFVSMRNEEVKVKEEIKLPYPKLRVDCRHTDLGNITSIVLDGKELYGIKSLKLEVPPCDRPPMLTLEIDVSIFNRVDIPDYMK